MIYELFPAEYIELNKELCSGLHPELEKIVAKFGPEDLDMKLAQCAAYVGIVLDDLYSVEDRARLCKNILIKLTQLRIKPKTIIIH